MNSPARPNNLENAINDYIFGGVGVRRAVVTFEKLASSNPDAAALLSRCMRRGDNGDISLADAKQWAQHAAERGSVFGFYEFACVLEALNMNTEASKWFSKAANSKDVLSKSVFGQFVLGCMFRSGLGVAQDEIQATMWLEKSAEQGCLEAQYLCGTGNSPSAAKWLRIAAENRHMLAQYELAQKYLQQDDYKNAAQWFRAAANQGHKASAFCLGTLCNEAGKCVIRSVAELIAMEQIDDQTPLTEAEKTLQV